MWDEEKIRLVYESDTGRLKSGIPDIVVIPRTAEEVSSILKFANETKTKVTVKGGGTTWEGETVADGGILLDMKGMNRLIEVNPAQGWITAEAGITWIKLYSELKRKGMTFRGAPDNLVSTLGGAISTSGYSYHCTKYGSIADQVLQLEVVLPGGDIINCGSNKIGGRVYGADPLPLFKTSLGTFGIITKVTLRAYQYTSHNPAYITGFIYDDIEKAVSDLPVIAEKCSPDILFFGSNTREFTMKYREVLIEETKKLGCSYSRKIPYLVQLYSNYANLVKKEMPERINFIFTGYEGTKKGTKKLSSAAKGKRFIEYSVEDEYIVRGKALWRMLTLGGHVPALCDCVVPRERAGEIIRSGIEEFEKTGFNPVVYGLLLPGHFSIGIGFYTSVQRSQIQKYENVRREIYEKTLSLGGTAYKYGGLRKSVAERSIGSGFYLMDRFKKYIDRNNILNCDVLF
ncbi:FAD/FMN-dependent dehydrogenase [Candidatus Methanoperedens nitroreducens]|uniref:D-lactate dehydrogenase (cytochrome) n=1 Tax=Candidatus Methanoperedens nitratireducens TaxID=1392998 RepID=A0A062V589_9EURY|nr:FAD-binding oxidoreductase [Candidatus Methanoperedens nitroreducens]KCZ72472.1 FAD/FMN-dependent dehydrogenase [Candidatus Methanoperedens nitroreducens]MDJ1423594.1 FAD-binding oxidoreductase [Candidatus Methanoperedens sp.]